MDNMWQWISGPSRSIARTFTDTAQVNLPDHAHGEYGPLPLADGRRAVLPRSHLLLVSLIH
eukprot:471713-Hanusia_phi.AAC.2